MARVPGFIKRAPRIDFGRMAVLIDSAGSESDVKVLDISSAGIKLEVSKAPRIGAVVTLRMDGSPSMRAQVRWAVGNQAGGIFLDPVDPADLD
jgi:hypothetical protein